MCSYSLGRYIGSWNSIYKRFNAWSSSGKWVKISRTLVVEPDWEWAFWDGSYVRAHQHSAGAATQSTEAIVADKGYDSERLREQIEQQGSQAVISRKRNSIKGNGDLDRGLYRCRHLVENAFARLKQFRAIACRFDKLKRNYESMVAMAGGFLWLPM